MEENKFFKWVWRFNGLVICAAGVVAIVVLLFVAYKLFKDVTRERTTRHVVNIAENAAIKENWRLGQLSSLNDGKILMIPLHSEQSFSRAYYSKSLHSTRNFLFINTQTSQKTWLFDHSDYLIERSETLRLGDHGGYY